jgi:imidazole glycerol phosphate synthase subunit HisF
MAYKRLVGVLAVRDGQVVKSYGYDFWRPAGRLCTALKNLDRWQVDEILVLDISRRDRVNDDVIREIRTARISTPLAYGGGIRKSEDVNPLLTAGCERFVLETMLFQYPDRIQCRRMEDRPSQFYFESQSQRGTLHGRNLRDLQCFARGGSSGNRSCERGKFRQILIDGF